MFLETSAMESVIYSRNERGVQGILCKNIFNWSICNSVFIWNITHLSLKYENVVKSRKFKKSLAVESAFFPKWTRNIKSTV